MQPSVPRGNKKKIDQPVIITTDTKFTPKISERTRRKRQEAKDNRYKRSKFASGLDLCGIICLYGFLILCVLIGAGGVIICGLYFNANASTQGWKIAGIALGILTCIIGIILILITIFKQGRNRPWRYKKQENTFYTEDFYADPDDLSKTNIEDLDDKSTRNNTPVHRDSPTERKNTSVSPVIHISSGRKTRETASSPIQDPSVAPLELKTNNNDLIFCPGCNRLHPSSHQCMYATRIANGFSTQFRNISNPPSKGSIAIQTEDEGRKIKKAVPHAVIDRTLKYSNTTETQTDVTANPRSNITESIILRRVPIPTAKVIVQQPTTKVMIVKVPNTAGQLVIQPKIGFIDEQPN
ncbi:unnamed protein product [Rotaria magnacalcarata]|uniref:Uncharacterized protein n=1 Tax=Rotaria magnacalcarata TaxID=392030 RepID=A0A819VNA7_9BILA|nr:unnamed protein product [Rotaria magnacalcarata]CAF2134030.1 unnamed protein product [Rotaria magnacalcarata]CAF3923771.1 unnamed protein product [Rotaria magnacalcarata]CAF4111868.1 unnamed protein product [Rotaria magnacalcarata]